MNEFLGFSIFDISIKLSDCVSKMDGFSAKQQLRNKIEKKQQKRGSI